ncbi:hypothetical protein MRX96_031006 [Rhipicephalus microplus]
MVLAQTTWERNPPESSGNARSVIQVPEAVGTKLAVAEAAAEKMNAETAPPMHRSEDVHGCCATWAASEALGQSRWQPLPSGRRLCRQQCCAEARAARDAWRRSLNTQRQRIRRLDDAYRIAERARNAQLQRRLRNALERDRLQFGSIEELTWLRDCFDKEEWAFLESLWPKPTRSVGRPRSGWLRTPLITGHPPSDDEKPSLLLLSVPNAVPRASSTVTLEDLLSGALPLRVPPEGGSQVAGDE